MDRKAQLQRFHRLLNSEDGRLLMAELKSRFDSKPIRGEETPVLIEVGERNAYKVLEGFQNGDHIQ